MNLLRFIPLAFGVLAIPVFASSCFDNVFNSKQVKDGFRVFTQSQLVDLVANIELYKLQHGAYPDSLSHVGGKNTFLSKQDPMQSFSHPGHSDYMYRKIGEKYTVYAVGDDGIAGTKDDLYPEVEIPDSSKIGLVRAK